MKTTRIGTDLLGTNLVSGELHTHSQTAPTDIFEDRFGSIVESELAVKRKKASQCGTPSIDTCAKGDLNPHALYGH